jgi:RNA polymerase sigma-70 factor (ECF subfamily)
MEKRVERRDEVARLRHRDPAAWEEMFRRLYPAMLLYAARRLATGDEASDAVAETMARAIAAIDRFDERGPGPDAWLFGILRHVVLDAQRHRYRHEEELPVTQLEDTGDHADALVVDEEHAAVRDAFSRLTEKEKELLELRVVAGLSSEEVASVLGMRPGAVRMAQVRALTRLRRLLERSTEQGD